MSIAEVAQLIVRLSLKDEASKAVGGLKTNLGDLTKIASGVATVGFAAMTKGALEMEGAQGRFQAATGASREEAIKFSQDMNGIVDTAGAVGLSFEDISDAGIMVSQQFGVTGEDAKDLTEDILNFAKVTGQDAEQAASDMEDALSAFGLEAEDATGFMDKLVTASQKYGVEAGPASVDALRQMAPALQAMGEDLDYGIQVLGLFEEAGIDAAAGPMALQKAVDDLEPGQSFDDIITKLGAIEDPAKRAEEAVKIFGDRAGYKMANAIKPGMTSLDDFAVSADESAGATEQAAEDMLTTTDKFRQFAQKIGGLFREGGQMFGPLMSGLGGAVTAVGALPNSLTTPLTNGLKGVFTRLASSAPIKLAAAAVGTATGLAMEAAHTVASTGAAALRSFLSKFGLMTGAKVAAAAAAGAATGAAEGGAHALAHASTLKARLPALIGGTLAVGAGAVVGTGIIEGATDALGDPANLRGMQDTFNGALQHQMSQSGQVGASAVGQGFVGQLPNIARHITTATVPVAERTGEDIGVGLGHGIAQSKPAVMNAFDVALVASAQAKMAQAQREVAQNARELTNDMAGALRNGKDDVGNAMSQLTWAIKHPMALTRQLAEIEGALTSQKMSNGLRSNNPMIRTVAEQQQQILIDRWESLTGRAYTEGVQIANASERGLATFNPAAWTIPRPRLPGGKDGNFWTGRAAGGPIEENRLYRVGEHGPEWFVSGNSGRIIPNGVSPGGVMGGGGSLNLRLRTEVVISAREVVNATRHVDMIQGHADRV